MPRNNGKTAKATRVTAAARNAAGDAARKRPRGDASDRPSELHELVRHNGIEWWSPRSILATPSAIASLRTKLGDKYRASVSLNLDPEIASRLADFERTRNLSLHNWLGTYEVILHVAAGKLERLARLDLSLFDGVAAQSLVTNDAARISAPWGVCIAAYTVRLVNERPSCIAEITRITRDLYAWPTSQQWPDDPATLPPFRAVRELQTIAWAHWPGDTPVGSIATDATNRVMPWRWEWAGNPTSASAEATDRAARRDARALEWAPSINGLAILKSLAKARTCLVFEVLRTKVGISRAALTALLEELGQYRLVLHRGDRGGYAISEAGKAAIVKHDAA